MSATSPGCVDVRDDLDAYTLGALDPDDARRVEQHVAACADCRRLLDDARKSVAALALSVPISSAGPAARARLLARAAADDAEPAVVRHPSSTNRWWLAAAAVLVAALAGVSAWALIAQSRVNDLERDRTAARASANAQASALAAQRAMLDVIAQRDAQVVSLYGRDAAAAASAQYVWSATRGAGVFVVTGLQQLPAGQTYEAWSVHDSVWKGVGTFSVDASGSGALLVRDEGDDGAPGGSSWYCITVEPAGGSSNRTGDIILGPPVR
jgi:anti-sigma-K factor RskA